jgi:hypothetical protein
MKHDNDSNLFDEQAARRDDDPLLAALRDKPEFDDGDEFTHNVVERWETEAANPVAGHIGTRRAVAVIVGWAAVLGLIVLAGRNGWFHPDPPTQPEPPQIGLLIKDVHQQYGRHSANLTQVVDQSTDMMNMDRVVDLFIKLNTPDPGNTNTAPPDNS